MVLCEWDAPEGDPGQSCLLVSYRRLSAQFQFSLSAVTLGYLSQWDTLTLFHLYHYMYSVISALVCTVLFDLS
jgi:hypothetical protein